MSGAATGLRARARSIESPNARARRAGLRGGTRAGDDDRCCGCAAAATTRVPSAGRRDIGRSSGCRDTIASVATVVDLRPWVRSKCHRPVQQPRDMKVAADVSGRKSCSSGA